MVFSLDAISAKNPFVRYERHAGDKVQSEVFGTYHMSTVASNYLRDYFGKDDDSYANEAILDKIFTYTEAQKARYLTPKDRKQLPYYLWALSCSTALNDELGVDLFKYFTEEDFQKIAEEKNRREYIAMGPSEEYGELALDQAAGTLSCIIEKADEALAGGPYSGTLRYGHDSQLTPLTSLMLIEGCCTPAEDPAHPESVWRIGEICPMAANIQMIFFRMFHQKPKCFICLDQGIREMVFGYQNVVNIYKIKSFCADIIQQSRGITLRKRISYAFTSTEKTSPMKVYKGRVRCIPVLVWIGDIKVTVRIVLRVLDFRDHILSIIL